MAEIKPCPFCGSDDLGLLQIRKPLPDFEDMGGDWEVYCRDCETMFIFQKATKAQLIERWNKRGVRTNEY